MYGGATFVSSLIKARLINDYHLFINPSAIGNGLTIFKNLNEGLNLTLINSITFNCEIVIFNYVPKQIK